MCHSFDLKFWVFNTLNISGFNLLLITVAESVQEKKRKWNFLITFVVNVFKVDLKMMMICRGGGRCI